VSTPKGGYKKGLSAMANPQVPRVIHDRVVVLAQRRGYRVPAMYEAVLEAGLKKMEVK
jgi:hypothetical protein